MNFNKISCDIRRYCWLHIVVFVCVRSCSHLFVILVLFFFFVILEQKEEVLKKQRAEKEKLKAFREKVSIRLYCTH